MNSAISGNTPFALAVGSALSASGLNIRERCAEPTLWAETCSHLEFIPVDYSASMIDYQLEYWSGNGQRTEDGSVILMHDNRPCAVWPLSLKQVPGSGPQIGSNGCFILPPIFVEGLSLKTIKKVTAECLAALSALCKGYGQSEFESSEGFAGNFGLSEWHHQLLTQGAIVHLSHQMFVNLAPSLPEIKSAFRKSYKSLITSGSRLWDIHILSQAAPGEWDEFRHLHLTVAGRSTRSLASWRLQYEALVAGDAFLVYLRNEDGRMVGAGLFHLTRDEGFYAVGAYDRTLFAKPLGHVVQYHAIDELKRRGIRWYRLGERVYPADMPSPTEKEIAISEFKQGFASHLFPSYKIHHALK